MAETDAFKFSELKIFEGIREDNLPDDAKEIFDVYEDMLFFWEHKNFCIKVVNYRRLAQSKSIANEKVQVCIVLIKRLKVKESKLPILILDIDSCFHSKYLYCLKDSNVLWRQLLCAFWQSRTRSY